MIISFLMLLTVPGDKSAMNPSGIRLGTPALTTRGLREPEMENVVDFIDRGRMNVILVVRSFLSNSYCLTQRTKVICFTIDN